MLSLIARWGHNVLLVGSSFLVLAVSVRHALRFAASRRDFQVRRRDVPRFPQHPAVVAHVITDQHEEDSRRSAGCASLPAARPRARCAAPLPWRRGARSAPIDRSIGRRTATRPQCPCRCAARSSAGRSRSQKRVRLAPQSASAAPIAAARRSPRERSRAERSASRTAIQQRKIAMRTIMRVGRSGWRPKVRRNRRYRASGMRSGEDPRQNSQVVGRHLPDTTPGWLNKARQAAAPQLTGASGRGRRSPSTSRT